ncbi:hypothetical protein BC826DRAFT_1036190 [Russula brevipes]|nr:hypothetical protein BC826DRAFT_1036190 [Russula brevipes]
MNQTTFTASPAPSALAEQRVHLPAVSQHDQASPREIITILEQLRLHMVQLDQRVALGFQHNKQDILRVEAQMAKDTEVVDGHVVSIEEMLKNMDLDNRIAQMTENSQEVVGHVVNIEQTLNNMDFDNRMGQMAENNQEIVGHVVNIEHTLNNLGNDIDKSHLSNCQGHARSCRSRCEH